MEEGFTNKKTRKTDAKHRISEDKVFNIWYNTLEDDHDYTTLLANKSTFKGDLWKLIQKHTESKKIVKWHAWAASFTVLIVAAVLFNLLHKQVFVFQTAFGEIKTYRLPDSSEVQLNGNSRLIYYKSSMNEVRRVKLKGEASFHVTHKSNRQPFIVELSDTTEVKVLGTVFNVLNRSYKSQVALKEGSVLFNYSNHHKVSENIMKPGDLIEVSKDAGFVTYRHGEETEDYFSWQKGKLILKNISLKELMTMLKDSYGINIAIHENTLLARTASGSLPLAKDKNQLLSNIMDLYELGLKRNFSGRVNNHPKTDR